MRASVAWRATGCAAPARPALHRLSRVLDDVEDHLDQLFLVRHQERQAGVVIAADLQAVREFGQRDAAHALQHFMDIDFGAHMAAVRRQQAIHQRLQAQRLFITAVYSFSSGRSSNSCSSNCAAPRMPPEGS